MPFTDWETTKSVLEVAIRGPKADMRLIAAISMKVKQSLRRSGIETLATKTSLQYGRLGKPLAKSPPIHTYDFRNFSVAVKLSEAGTLKEAFEKASEKNS